MTILYNKFLYDHPYTAIQYHFWHEISLTIYQILLKVGHVSLDSLSHRRRLYTAYAILNGLMKIYDNNCYFCDFKFCFGNSTSWFPPSLYGQPLANGEHRQVWIGSNYNYIPTTNGAGCIRVEYFANIFMYSYYPTNYQTLQRSITFVCVFCNYNTIITLPVICIIIYISMA